MDLDKIAAFVSKVGLVPAGLIWLAWELHGFVSRVAASQDKIIEVLNKLVELHK